MLKADGHYAGDLVSLDFKSESLHGFLETVVQLVNQHSQKINALEMDKISIEDITDIERDEYPYPWDAPVVRLVFSQ